MPTRAALHDASARRHVCKSSLFQPVVKEQHLPCLERKGSFYIIPAFFSRTEERNSDACQRGFVTTSPEASRNPSTKARFEFWRLGAIKISPPESVRTRKFDMRDYARCAICLPPQKEKFPIATSRALGHDSMYKAAWDLFICADKHIYLHSRF